MVRLRARNRNPVRQERCSRIHYPPLCSPHVADVLQTHEKNTGRRYIHWDSENATTCRQVDERKVVLKEYSRKRLYWRIPVLCTSMINCEHLYSGIGQKSPSPLAHGMFALSRTYAE